MEWTEIKINKLIDNKIEENIHLDYKAAGALDFEKVESRESKKKDIAEEITKDVSAFANSDGGVIIYGVKESSNKKQRFPEEIDPIDRTKCTPERLEQIINSISPRIYGVVVTTISIGQKEDNKVVYVVEIPKSNTAHQAKDKRYYRRYNFEVNKMDDWEIRDVMNRDNKSDIEIFFKPHDYQYLQKKDLSDEIFKVDLWLENKGNKAAQYLNIFIYIATQHKDLFLNPKPLIDEDDTSTCEIQFNNELQHKIKIDEKEFVVNVQNRPILPFVSMYLSELKIKSDVFINDIEVDILVITEDNKKTFRKKFSELLKFNP